MPGQRIRIVLLAAVGLLTACGVELPQPPGTPDASAPECAVPCVEVCCEAGETCDPATLTCAPACVPNCAGRACGDDGCGGSCGRCAQGLTCEAGGCVCRPDCSGRSCGDDGCGGSCGTCAEATSCQAGACVACVRDCRGRACGYDGCGGLCGACEAGHLCREENGSCAPCTDDASCAGHSAGPFCIGGRCTACRTDGDCAKGRCDPALARCVECGSDGHCAATPSTPYCLDMRCVPCRADEHCPATEPECGASGVCGPRGGNDTCAGAQPLVFAGSVARASGDTRGAANDDRGECGGGGGDRVYRVELSAGTFLDVTVSPRTVGLQPVVYVRAAECGRRVEEVGCAVSPAAGAAVRLALNDLPQGTYYVWVDSVTGSAGASDLELALRPPPPPPPHDTCAGAELLSFVNGRAAVNGDTRGATATTQASCGGSGRDAVYRITTTSEQKLVARVQRDFSTPAMRPLLHLRKACSDGNATSELACAEGAAGVGTLTVERLPAGEWFLWVDSDASAGGRFSLTVELSAPGAGPANENCVVPEPLVFDGAGKAQVSSTLKGALSHAKASCGGSSGGDVVYRFTTTAEQHLVAKLSGLDADASPVVHLRKSCGDRATEVACGTKAGFEVNVLPPGEWFVWVAESWSASYQGPFTLELQLGPPRHPPANDVCAGATPLSFAAGAATVNGSTRLATPSTTSSCGSSGADVVYGFTTLGERSVTLTVTPSTGSTGFEPVVFLRTDCNQAGAVAEKACGTFANGKAAARADTLPAGTYFVWVSNDGGPGGDFSLRVELADPVAPVGNDTCPGMPVTFTNDRAVLTGSTELATHAATSAVCGGQGPDHVYAITLPTRSSLEAGITSLTPGFTPVLYLRKVCGSAVRTDELDCASAYDRRYVAAGSLEAGTYFLWIDGYGGSRGEYRAEVVRGPTPTAPLADTCPGAVLTLVNGTVTVDDDLRLAAYDEDGTCTYGSRDAVFEFAIPAQQSLRAKVVPLGPGLAPSVFIRSLCGDSDSELVCGHATDSGRTIEAVVPNAPAGTYAVWVKAEENATGIQTTGRFRLELTAAAPLVPPANDSCAGPADIAAGATVQGTTVGAAGDFGATGPWGSCSTSYPPIGPDLVYRFVPAASKAYTITVQPEEDYDVSLWVTTTCGAPASCVARRDDNYAGTAETVTLNATAGTTYFIHVDSFAKEAGAFTLSVQ